MISRRIVLSLMVVLGFACNAFADLQSETEAQWATNASLLSDTDEVKLDAFDGQCDLQDSHSQLSASFDTLEADLTNAGLNPTQVANLVNSVDARLQNSSGALTFIEGKMAEADAAYAEAADLHSMSVTYSLEPNWFQARECAEDEYDSLISAKAKYDVAKNSANGNHAANQALIDEINNILNQ